MADFKMEGMVLGAVSTNCFLVWNEDTREAFVVDPADHAAAIMKRIELHKLSLKAILLTHGHFDHMLAVPALKQLTGAKIYAGIKEQALLSDGYMNLSGSWGNKDVTFEADHWVTDNEEMELCGFKVRCLETPGHTEGGVCYYLYEEGQLFAGDTLFYGSYGRTDLPTGNTKKLFKSIVEKLLVLPEETIVYPGHGNGTSIEMERRINPVARGMKF